MPKPNDDLATLLHAQIYASNLPLELWPVLPVQASACILIPWFELDLLPVLRSRVAQLLAQTSWQAD